MPKNDYERTASHSNIVDLFSLVQEALTQVMWLLCSDVGANATLVLIPSVHGST